MQAHQPIWNAPIVNGVKLFVKRPFSAHLRGFLKETEFRAPAEKEPIWRVLADFAARGHLAEISLKRLYGPKTKQLNTVGQFSMSKPLINKSLTIVELTVDH
jgi:hypothetical protein